jgi:hypothetical protein
MCGSACVYILLPQQRKYEKKITTTIIIIITTKYKEKPDILIQVDKGDY